MDRAKGRKINVGIGLGDEKLHNLKILKALLHFLNNNDSIIHCFGNNHAIKHVRNEREYQENKKKIIFIENEDPEKKIIESLNNAIIDAIIRGSLSSSKFLINVKRGLNIPEIHRLTLLETYEGFQFFYGPVGIDECNTFKKKRDFIQMAISVFNLLNILPKVSILSGGRRDDLGRDEYVDNSMEMAMNIVQFFKKEYPSLMIDHDEILIEKSIEKESNLIIAPEGISGNLIYRTLVHLGGGKAYGAIYMGINRVIIDTSRVGNFSEIIGALYLALALTP